MPNKLEYYELKKSLGGLGIKYTYNHNLALFRELVWRLLKDADALWGKLLKEKYVPNSNFLKAKVSSNAIPFWKKLVKIKSTLLLNWFWDIKDPSSISIWEDHGSLLSWLKPMGPKLHIPNVDKVSDLLLPNSRLWSIELLNKIFLPLEV